MSDRVALITGGAKGIGRAIALDLAAQGWSVAICYRTSEEAAQATNAAMIERGGRALAVRCDVSDAPAAHAFVERVQRQWGRIDALINCAGPYHRISLFDETVEGWNEMFDGNLHPIFYLAQAVAPLMKAREIWPNREFQHGERRSHDRAAGCDGALYCEGRGADPDTHTGKDAGPVRRDGQCDLPGFIDSGSAPPEELAGAIKRIPAGYLGEVSDTTGAVRYLLSDEARYVNGANIHVNGGWGI